MSRYCSKYSHICNEKALIIFNSINNNTCSRNDFIIFLDYIKNNIYNNCNKNKIVSDTMIKGSELFGIDGATFVILLQYSQDDENFILTILKNCVHNDNSYVYKLFNQHNTAINVFSAILEKKYYKVKDLIIDSMSINHFVSFFKNIYSKLYSYTYCDNFIIDYIKKYKDNFSDSHINDLTNTIPNRLSLLKSIYTILIPKINPQNLKSILDKMATSLDKEIILLILVTNADTKPDITTVRSLISRSQCTENGSYNKKEVATILDIFISHGLVITKEIILLLLDHGCYINNIEKYNIDIDEEIILKCIDKSYYPYEYKFIPTTKCIFAECTKNNNLEQIKILKEKGALFLPEHLDKACGIRKNGKVIKFLINECNVVPNDECIKSFEKIYNTDGLEILISKFKKETVKQNTNNENNYLQLNNDCLINIESKMNLDNIDYSQEYDLKNKIRNLLKYKQKKISFSKLHELILNYFIENHLVIGNYVIIDNALSTITKLPNNGILYVDSLYNLCSYMID